MVGIYLGSILILIAKFADIYTTHKGIEKHGIEMEKNLIAKFMFYKFGEKNTYIIIFLIHVIVLAIITIAAHFFNNEIRSIFALFMGVVLGALLFVSFHNYKIIKNQ